MNFQKSITLSAKIYNLLEKFHLEEKLPLDSLIDNNYPQILSKLQTYSKFEKMAICATNGKRTTVNFLNQILQANKNTYISNITQQAKKYPILTSIILNLAKNKDLLLSDTEIDYYTMAMDEFELGGYFNSIKFDYLLLHNLFVDQKDFSSIFEKRKKIQEAIVLNSKLNLVINADEPMFYKIDEIKNDTLLNKKRNKIYYGFNKIEPYDSNFELVQKNDLIKCPVCGCSLDYKKRYYSHLGQYDCACGFKRPTLDISAEAKVFSDYTFMNVFYGDKKYVFKLPLGNIYNAYNALGAIALAICLNIDRKTITSSFENYKSLKARDEINQFKNKNIKVKVIKNPVSLSESIKELYGSKNTKVVFCLNDEETDGIDTSWIWDSNFNSFHGFENKIFVSGSRYDDMALRLKYSGVNPCLIVMDSNVKNAIGCCYYELEEGEDMLVLTCPSYVNEIYNSLKL